MAVPEPPGGDPAGDRRRTILAAVLATLFVGVIIASSGYVATHRRAPAGPGGTATPAASRPGGTATVRSGTGPGTAITPAPVPGGTGGSPAPPGGAAGASPAPAPVHTPVGPCPDVTQAAAERAGSPGGLRTVRYALTARSEVWVCRDSAGRLWYQGHLRADPLVAATSDSSLLLADVAPEPDGYLATNRGQAGTETRYRVSATVLLVQTLDAAGRQIGLRTEPVLVTAP